MHANLDDLPVGGGGDPNQNEDKPVGGGSGSQMMSSTSAEPDHSGSAADR